MFCAPSKVFDIPLDPPQNNFTTGLELTWISMLSFMPIFPQSKLKSLVFATVLKNKTLYYPIRFAIQIFSANRVEQPILGYSRIPIPPRIKLCCSFTRRDGVEGAGIPSSLEWNGTNKLHF